jgi:hypothetical protein
MTAAATGTGVDLTVADSTDADSTDASTDADLAAVGTVAGMAVGTALAAGDSSERKFSADYKL